MGELVVPSLALIGNHWQEIVQSPLFWQSFELKSDDTRQKILFLEYLLSSSFSHLLAAILGPQGLRGHNIITNGRSRAPWIIRKIYV